jgi:hypothetical protein
MERNVVTAKYPRAVVMRTVGVVAALLLVASACTAAGDTSGGSTTATTVTTLEPTTPAATTPPERTIELLRIDDPSFDGGRLNAVVEAGPGLVAVGSDELPEDAAVWVSTDGRVWDRIESESFSGVADENGLEGAQLMRDVAVGPAGILAVGSYERKAARDVDAAVWLSRNGLEWERVAASALSGTGSESISSLDVWNDRYVAGGEGPGPVGSGERRPAIWISEDGREWERIDSSVFRMDGAISAVTHRGSRIVAVGTSGHVARPTVWISDDGRAWEVVFSEDTGGSEFERIAIGDVARFEDVFMSALAATPDGFVGAGSVGEPSRVVFWKSSNALIWEPAGFASDFERASAPVSVSSMVATESGVVAVGTGRLDSTRFPPLSYAELWVSSDGGLTWLQIPRTGSSTVTEGPNAPWHMGAMTDVITFDGGIVATGFVPLQNVTLPGPFFRQAVWLGFWE